MRGRTAILGAIVAFLLHAPAMGAGPLDAIASCTLTLNASGTLKMSGDGRTLASNASGGLPASMLLVGVNLTPELVFSAPTVLGPTGWSGTPTTAIAVDTLSGVHSGFSSNGLTIHPGALLDTLTVNASVTNTAGFKDGSYSVSSQVTCQSAS